MPVPLLAAAVADGLTDLAVVLAAAKAGAEVLKRLGQPTIVGEILAGVAIGPAALGLVSSTPALEILAELGVVLLLFWVGLETRLSDLRRVGRQAGLVGGLGVAFPLAGGLALGLALGESFVTALFVGTALVATSVGITSATLVELGSLRTRAGRTILAAAVIDDVLAMLVLAVSVGVAAGEGVDVAGIALTLAVAVAFVAIVALAGPRLLRLRPGLLTVPRFADSPLLPALILCLGLAAAAAHVGLAAIIGAFLAGMVLAEVDERHVLEREVAPLYALFPPFFFVWIGIQIDVSRLVRPGTLALLAGVTAVAVLTKLAGAWLGARSLGSREAAFVAIGMVPRGEVGVVIASVALAEAVIDATLFSVVVGMSVLTTLLVPPALRAVAAPGAADAGEREAAAAARAPVVR